MRKDNTNGHSAIPLGNKTEHADWLWSTTIRANNATLLVLLSPDKASPDPGRFRPFSARTCTKKQTPRETGATLPSWNLGFGSCFGAIHGLNYQNMEKPLAPIPVWNGAALRLRHNSARDVWVLRPTSFFFWVRCAEDAYIASYRIREIYQDAVGNGSWQHKLYFCVLYKTKFHSSISTDSVTQTLFILPWAAISG